MDRIFTPFFFTALLFCSIFSEVRSQNIYAPEGVNWVSANQKPTGYAQPVNGAPNDYRVLQYRKVSTTISNPNEGRGQWFTTINAQVSGGDVNTSDMGGGVNNGFLFTSGAGPLNVGTYQNKWNFLGEGKAAINSINNVQHTNSGGGQDMGLNMSAAGYYTFVLKDAGYTSSDFYVGYTTAAPVSFTIKETVLNPDSSVTITLTLSGNPSPQERFYARYSTTNNNDFSTALSQISDAGVVSGNEAVITIPIIAANTTVYYYVFSSTISKANLLLLNEGERSYALLHFQDNGGANFNYSTSATSTATDYFRSNVASGNWSANTSWQSSPDGVNWNAATIPPGANTKGVHIRNGDVIDITTAGITVDKTVVDGTLKLMNDGFTLADGIGADELTINNGGVLQCIFTTLSKTYLTSINYGSEGNINVNTGGKIIIGEGTAAHDAPGYSGFASEPASKVKWNDGAIFEWNTSGINFTPGQVYFPDALLGDKSIFRVSQVFTTTNPGSGDASPLTFNGVFEVLIDFTLEGSGPKNFRDGIIGTSTLTLLTGSGTHSDWR